MPISLSIVLPESTDEPAAQALLAAMDLPDGTSVMVNSMTSANFYVEDGELAEPGLPPAPEPAPKDTPPEG